MRVRFGVGLRLQVHKPRTKAVYFHNCPLIAAYFITRHKATQRRQSGKRKLVKCVSFFFVHCSKLLIVKHRLLKFQRTVVSVVTIVPLYPLKRYTPARLQIETTSHHITHIATFFGCSLKCCSNSFIFSNRLIEHCKDTTFF